MLNQGRNRVRGAATRLVAFVEDRSGVFVLFWIALYLAALVGAAKRPLWYDELLTYYTAAAPTFEIFFGRILHIDLNPPLEYLPVRISLMLFGDSPLAVRIPSLIAFVFAGLMVYKFVRHRLGGAYALTAFGVFWSCGFLSYAIEARPYALMLAFFVLASVCWLQATAASRWIAAHWGLLAGVSGMLLSHCFAPVYLVAIGCGELVRTLHLGKIDRRIWTALLLPAPLVISYLPLVRHAQAVMYPAAFQVSGMTVLVLLFEIARALGLVFVFAVLLLLRPRRTRTARLAALIQPHELAFGAVSLIAPFAIMSYCAISGVPFWLRYSIGAAIPLSVGLSFLIAYQTNCAVWAGVLATALCLFQFPISTYRVYHLPRAISPQAYRSVRTDLPFVAASGLTFVEMDQREPPEFVGRLFYLTDRDAATRYAHASIFEHIRVLQEWSPMRAHVEYYRAFVTQHPRFLVLGTPGYPEDWLLAKLKDDGAEIRLIGSQDTGYKDRNLYEVTVR